jgi:hypothetical protein
MFVLRPIQKQALSPTKMLAAVQSTTHQVQTVDHPAMAQGNAEDGNKRALRLKEETIELIKQQPVNTARALQAWLHEEPS